MAAHSRTDVSCDQTEQHGEFAILIAYPQDSELVVVPTQQKVQDRSPTNKCATKCVFGKFDHSPDRESADVSITIVFSRMHTMEEN